MNHHPTQTGFTLVETLVAITILLMVMVAPLTITSNAARSSSFSSEQVTAFFLAQEGVELVTKARDDLLILNFLDVNADPAVFTPSNPDPWADFTRTNNLGQLRLCYTTVNSSGCDLTINANGSLTVTNCRTQGACQLYLNTTTNNLRSRFTHAVIGNQFTPFTRVITLRPILDSAGNVNEVAITSKVTWRTGSQRAGQEVLVESRVFNLYGN